MAEGSGNVTENAGVHDNETIAKPKRRRGRPKGAKNKPKLNPLEAKQLREEYGMTEKPKGGGQQMVQRLRLELYRSIDLLESRGKPLHTLIADSMEADTPKALSALARFLPSDVKIEGSVTLVNALDEIGKAIDLHMDDDSGDYVVHEDTENDA